MGREVFQDLSIAICGDFGESWNAAKFKRFIENNGGKAVGVKSKEVTHLITTIKAWDGRHNAILIAQKKRIYIVTFDWFEDSLQSHRKKRESQYSIAKAAKERRRAKKDKKRVRKAKVSDQVAELLQGEIKTQMVYEVQKHPTQLVYKFPGYQVYTDPTGFVYTIPLVRLNIFDNRNERITVQIVQTFEEPHYFACLAQYKDQEGKMSSTINADFGSSFEEAFLAFQRVFKERTHKDWENRADGEHVLLKDGQRDPQAYIYKPPKEGPIGMDGPVIVDKDGYLTAVKKEKFTEPPQPTTVEVVNGQDDNVQRKTFGVSEAIEDENGLNQESSQDADRDTTADNEAVGTLQNGVLFGNWGQALVQKAEYESAQQQEDWRKEAQQWQVPEVDKTTGSENRISSLQNDDDDDDLSGFSQKPQTSSQQHLPVNAFTAAEKSTRPIVVFGEVEMPHGVVEGSWGGRVL